MVPELAREIDKARLEAKLSDVFISWSIVV
jgi:hypothetical protein